MLACYITRNIAELEDAEVFDIGQDRIGGTLNLPDFWEGDNTISASWWLRISTWLNPLAVFRTLRPFGSVQVIVVTFLGILSDPISTLWSYPLTIGGTRISVFAVGFSVIASLSRFDNTITARVVADDGSTIP